jgi:hypothetical protein
MDLRKPSGIFFALMGAIVFLTGIIAPGLKAPLTSVNVNLYSGISMLVFGGFLLWLALRVR